MMYDCVFVSVCGNGINTLDEIMASYNNINNAFKYVMDYNTNRLCSCRVEVRECVEDNKDQ